MTTSPIQDSNISEPKGPIPSSTSLARHAHANRIWGLVSLTQAKSKEPSNFGAQ